MAETLPNGIVFETYTYRQMCLGSFSIDPSASKIPISRLRFLSQTNNPRALPEDLILVTVKLNGELIAFRTVLPDNIELGVRSVHFAWLSGVWVAPQYRRLGISRKMFDIIFQAWNGLLLGTEYTPANGLAITSSGQLGPTISKPGVRIFYKSPLEHIILNKYKKYRPFRNAFKLADTIIDTLVKGKNMMYGNISLPDEVKYTISEKLSDKAKSFIDEYRSYSSTNRRVTELDWIVKYPWLASDPKAIEESKKYYFSVFAAQFTVCFLEIYQRSDIKAIVMLTLRDGILKIPYLFTHEKDKSDVASCILRYASDNKVKLIVSYHTQLNDRLLSLDNKRIIAKKTTRYYLVTKILNEIIPAEALIFADGDGDCVFV